MRIGKFCQYHSCLSFLKKGGVKNKIEVSRAGYLFLSRAKEVGRVYSFFLFLNSLWELYKYTLVLRNVFLVERVLFKNY